MTSGSDRRQRDVSLSARFDGAEAAQIRANANRAGVSVASLIRMALLDEPTARATRRPTADIALLARLLHDLGPIADSLRQIAAHPGREEDPRLAVALDQLADMSIVCLQAMRRTPHRPGAAPGPSLAEPLSAIWQSASSASPAEPAAPAPDTRRPPPDHNGGPS